MGSHQKASANAIAPVISVASSCLRSALGRQRGFEQGARDTLIKRVSAGDAPSYNSCSVTPGRRNSRWIATQSDRGRRSLAVTAGGGLSRHRSASSVRPFRQASRNRHAAPAGGTPRRARAHPEAGGDLAFGVLTCRRRTASARRGSCAWVISVQAQRSTPCDRSPDLPHVLPRAGRVIL
jgi:hypothetical protein